MGTSGQAQADAKATLDGCIRIPHPVQAIENALARTICLFDAAERVARRFYSAPHFLGRALRQRKMAFRSGALVSFLEGALALPVLRHAGASG